jgi:hypothetical protein
MSHDQDFFAAVLALYVINKCLDPGKKSRLAFNLVFVQKLWVFAFQQFFTVKVLTLQQSFAKFHQPAVMHNPGVSMMPEYFVCRSFSSLQWRAKTQVKVLVLQFIGDFSGLLHANVV